MDTTQTLADRIRLDASALSPLPIMIEHGVATPRLDTLEHGFVCIRVGRGYLLAAAQTEWGHREGVAEAIVARAEPVYTSHLRQAMLAAFGA